MLRLIYISVQSPGLSKTDFEQLCEQAARTNQALNIGGLLLANDQEFMQCLEGPAAEVAAIYKKILVDPRHHDIRLIVCEPVRSLMFQTWAMVGLSLKPINTVSIDAMAYTLLDHRLYRPWKSLGLGAADLIYEYAKVKFELEKAGELGLLEKVFDVYPG
jgi:hypothetical protein